MLPELNVFYANSHQFVHPERITLYHKDLLFMAPAGDHKKSGYFNMFQV